jgi:hypothetical protein
MSRAFVVIFPLLLGLLKSGPPVSLILAYSPASSLSISKLGSKLGWDFFEKNI